MSSPLKTYRVCCFDAQNAIVSADWLQAADDADAIDRAHRKNFGDICEIWDGNRLVAQLAGERRQA